MAKKGKERSEAEYLRGQLKTLKSEIRHLKKEVARHEKRAHHFDESEKDDSWGDTQPSELHYQKMCPKCNSKIIETNIGPRLLIKCSSCDYRETKKK